jgi:hypothetical protein
LSQAGIEKLRQALSDRIRRHPKPLSYLLRSGDPEIAQNGQDGGALLGSSSFHAGCGVVGGLGIGPAGERH